MPADHRPTPPESSPLTYFGDWCGQGWSAGREGQAPLNTREKRRGAAMLTNRYGKGRESPVDLACKQHDLLYEMMSKEPNSYHAATMKLAADRKLLSRVSQLLREDRDGRSDMNMGEVLYAKNVQMAFGTMLFFDGVAVGRNLDIDVGPHVRRIAAQAAPYVLVILGGPTMISAQLLKLRVPVGR